VQWAPGIPHALRALGEIFVQNSGAICAARRVAYVVVIRNDESKIELAV
jgi:hypothetical protein